MSGVAFLASFAAVCMCIAAFLALIFYALVVEDRIVERVHRLHRAEWEAAGRPMGAWRVPEGAERSIRSRTRAFWAMNAWGSAKEGPLGSDEELQRLLRRRRTLTRAGYALGFIAFAGLLALRLF
jgi:hypothetical protein